MILRQVGTIQASKMNNTNQKRRKMDKEGRQDSRKEVEARVAFACPNCSKPALIWAIDNKYGVCPHCGNTFRL